MVAYYNEINPKAAQRIRELMADGEIAKGDVDERDIREVTADDIRRYTQCHFFAGLGSWSHALRLAGWPDDRPVWTGSCPCIDYSSMGKKAKQLGQHHFWPYWFRLIRECRPTEILGEQVKEAIAAGWLDEVFLNLEAEENACAAAVLPSYCVQADNERMRIYWVAYSTKQSRFYQSEPKKTAKRLHNNIPAWTPHTWNATEPKVYSIHAGLPSYVDQFEMLGNAIHVGVAAEFAASYLDARE